MKEATQGLKITFLGYPPSLFIGMFQDFIVKILKPCMPHEKSATSNSSVSKLILYLIFFLNLLFYNQEYMSSFTQKCVPT